MAVKPAVDRASLNGAEFKASLGLYGDSLQGLQKEEVLPTPDHSLCFPKNGLQALLSHPALHGALHESQV